MSKNRAIRKWQLERQLRYAVANTNAHLEENPEVDPKSALRASLSRAMERNAFLERVATEPWHTGSDKELHGFTGYGVDKSHKLNSGLDKNYHWGNNPIDLSFKNPVPEWRLPWFEDRVSENQVYGTEEGSIEWDQGENSGIKECYSKGESIIPGGGGHTKFPANRKNMAKHLTRLLSDYNTAADLGDKLTEEDDKSFKTESISEQVIDTIAYQVHYWKDSVSHGSLAFQPRGRLQAKKPVK